MKSADPRNMYRNSPLILSTSRGWRWGVFAAVLSLSCVACNQNPQGFITAKGQAALQSQLAGAGAAGQGAKERKLLLVTNYQDATVSAVSFTAKTMQTGMMGMNGMGAMGGPGMTGMAGTSGMSGMPGGTNMAAAMPGANPMDMFDPTMTTVSVQRITGGDFAVGQRPADIIISRDHNYAYIANSGEDSVSIVSLKSLLARVNSSTQPAKGGVLTKKAPTAPDASPDPSDTPAGTETIGVGSEPVRIAETADGQHLIVANRTGRSISVLKAAGLETQLLRTLDVQYSPNDVDIFDSANLVVVSSFLDGGFTIFNLKELIEEEAPKPAFIWQTAQPSAIAFSPRTNNVIAACLDLVALYPQGLDSLVRNASQIPMPTQGRNSDAMFDRSGKIAVIVNQTTNTATLYSFLQLTQVGAGFSAGQFDNLNIQPVNSVNVGMMPVRVLVDPNGRYAVTANSGSRNLTFLSVNFTRGLQLISTATVGNQPSALALY